MTRPGGEFDRGYDDQRYRGPRDYNSGRGYHTKDTYRSDDSQYYDENSSYDNYRRHSPPHRDVSPPFERIIGIFCAAVERKEQVFEANV